MDGTQDEVWMDQALDWARRAESHDDVPVGCVIVVDGQLIGAGENRRELDQDSTAHAEVVALRAAAATTGRWRLDGATVYVTLEPCVMCAGALLSARVKTVVYGADDDKAGAVGSRFNIVRDIRRAESADLLRSFFAARR